MKLCRVVFSTNRLEFLENTLKSVNQRLDFSNFDVDHIFIDDYPNNRDDIYITNLAVKYGFNHIILHKQNIGITETWQQFFDTIKHRNYDYIIHHEDDINITYDIKILDIIELLKYDKGLSQVQLKRNNWYSHEKEEVRAKDTDLIFKNYRYEKGFPYFSSLMSFYPSWISRIQYKEHTGNNPSESVIANYLLSKYNLTTGLLKTNNGNYMVEHTGEYTIGRKVSLNEPGWTYFCNTDPNTKTSSK